MILPPPDAIETIDLKPTVLAQRACYTNTQLDPSALLINHIGLTLNYEVVKLSDESYGRFVAILNAPPRPNENLRQTIRRYKR